jgi:glyoxylase-like metal-dependent hydrolase (beta-lactamase superfamily II)
MQKITYKDQDIKLYLLSAGEYYSDAGAAMGVLPRKLWDQKIKLDFDFCMKFELNCLLIKTNNHNILVDTGIGENYTEKQKRIYKPSKFLLLEELIATGTPKEDIDYVILTHLHFDHTGGILSKDNRLNFPNAEYIIQQSEFEIALNPDILNQSAYPLKSHYELLKNHNKLHLINNDYQLNKEITIKKTSGHSKGMQIVEINSNDDMVCFSGDLFPTRFHLNPAVTSAYEVNRETIIKEKINIIDRLNKTQGRLILGHEKESPILKFPL